jgi:hypothetical protein
MSLSRAAEHAGVMPATALQRLGLCAMRVGRTGLPLHALSLSKIFTYL